MYLRQARFFVAPMSLLGVGGPGSFRRPVIIITTHPLLILSLCSQWCAQQMVVGWRCTVTLTVGCYIRHSVTLEHTWLELQQPLIAPSSVICDGAAVALWQLVATHCRYPRVKPGGDLWGAENAQVLRSRTPVSTWSSTTATLPSAGEDDSAGHGTHCGRSVMERHLWLRSPDCSVSTVDAGTVSSWVYWLPCPIVQVTISCRSLPHPLDSTSWRTECPGVIVCFICVYAQYMPSCKAIWRTRHQHMEYEMA